MHKTIEKRLTVLAVLVLAGTALFTLQTKTPAALNPARLVSSVRMAGGYPYAGHAFDKFVAESYSYNNSKGWKKFYDRMELAYQHRRAKFGWKEDTLTGMLDAKRASLARISGSHDRAAAEVKFAASLHKFVKSSIPNFSLDRGFEFYNTDKRGERQCFLQSVLLSGMLQRAGVRTGVAMVYKNSGGVRTNNSHAVDLVRLANGRDIILDASEQTPFAKQRGLFVKRSPYAYVDPVYARGSNQIIRYRAASNGSTISRSGVEGLDYDFLRSQFWFYRGERASGGVVVTPKTAKGLKKAEQALATSVKICPENPLSVFTLGRVYVAEGKTKLQKETILNAYSLYSRFGWVPDGVKEYRALVGA